MFHNYESEPLLRTLYHHVNVNAETEMARTFSDGELLLQLRECTKKLKTTAGEAHRRARSKKYAITTVLIERYKAEKNEG